MGYQTQTFRGRADYRDIGSVTLSNPQVEERIRRQLASNGIDVETVSVGGSYMSGASITIRVAGPCGDPPSRVAALVTESVRGTTTNSYNYPMFASVSNFLMISQEQYGCNAVSVPPRSVPRSGGGSVQPPRTPRAAAPVNVAASPSATQPQFSAAGNAQMGSFFDGVGAALGVPAATAMVISAVALIILLRR